MNLLGKIKNNPKVIRFGIVGLINTIIDFGLLFLLKSIGLPIFASNIVSTGTAFVVSFFANKKYTFKTTGTNVVKEMILFVIITLTGLWLIQTLVIKYTMPAFGLIFDNANLNLFLAKALATAITMVWNFILYDKLVFKKS